MAIDGVDAAGKTTLANELVAPLRASRKQVIRASIDGFHHPRDVRLKRGSDSGEGYFLDSFDHEAMWSCLLAPLGPNGNRWYRTAVFDFRSDTAVERPQELADSDAILLFDGVFLMRPELNAGWDFRIFLEVGFDETLRRAAARDATLFGSEAATRERYEKRYIPGQRQYLSAVQPMMLADVVIDNTDPAKPVIKPRDVQL